MIPFIGLGDAARLDLNLATTFLAIWRHRSVSKAAQALNLSQSAVSGALGRLRAQVGDPLFVRTRAAMEPTPRATQIAPLIEAALGQMQQALGPAEPFEAARLARAITVGMSDDYMLACGPELVRQIAAQAPEASVIVRQCNSHTAQAMLESGEIELAMVAMPRLLGRTMRRAVIGRSDYLCLADAPALAVGFPLSLDDFVALPQILVSYSGRSGAVDQALEALGRERRILAALTQFAALPPFLLGANAVCTLPSHAALALAGASGLQTCPPPMAMPDYEISLVWRSDKHADPASCWLRATLVAAWESRAGRVSERLPDWPG